MKAQIMKGTSVYYMLTTIIALGLAAPERLITDLINELVLNNDLCVIPNKSICETPACVDSASFILKNMDSKVDPCENFYQFACGKFVEETLIPDDGDKVSTFSMVQSKINEQLRLRISDEIKEDDQPVTKKIKSYYQMCIDTDQIERTSENDLRKILTIQGGCPILESTSWDGAHFDWKKSVYESNKMGYSTDRFVRAFVSIDPHNNTKFITTIDQVQTELPREYYINGNNNSTIEAYAKSMIDILVLLGADRRQAEEEVNNIINFEIQLAQISLAEEERRDQSKLDNRMTLHQLHTTYSGISWAKYLNEILAPYAHLHQHDEVMVVDTSFLERLPKLLAKTPKRVLANYLCLRTISESIDYLGKDFLNVKVEVNKVFTGVEQRVPRWKECLKLVSEKFSAGLGELYVRHYFDKDAKTNAIRLTTNLRSSLNHLIEQADWLDNDTKFAALEKLHSIVAYIGYPDELEKDEKINEFYQDITLHPGSFLISAMNMEKFNKKLQYSSLKKPADPWINHCSVAVANAQYIDSGNQFELPAGILQGHFYDADRPNYMNYGAIGSVIGHEMSHAFDDQGNQYDKNGNLFSWWKNETKEVYLNKAKCIIEQYGNYTVKAINMKIKGISTQAENIADNVGLKAAYFAYDRWAKNNGTEPRLPGLYYTPHQMFWISYANNWCGRVRSEALKSAIITDTHASYDFRVVGPVSNIHQFAKDFKCPLGSPMNPVKKCSIW